jgi:hypothetical protein
MIQPIDFIIPFVNNQDKNWQNDFLKNKSLAGLKGDERFRDFGLLKYVFRSIETNCPWYRYIFLVLSGPSQIPSWLNINNSKLKIIYHKDYIPKDFLPTFNSNVIEMFYSFIEELSDNYIIMNDDFFFIQKIPENYFFENDEPKIQRKIQNNGLWRCGIHGDKCFVDTINNNSVFISKIFNSNIKTFRHFHMPTPLSKKLQQFIWFKYYDELYNSLKDSKFRTSKNYTQWLFEDIQKMLPQYKEANLYNKSHVYTMGDVVFNFKNYNMICFNDEKRYVEKSVKNFLNSINSCFPNKSSFEN